MPREEVNEALERETVATESSEAMTIAYGKRAGRVYDWILTRILTCELAPGSFIDKTAVAAAIGVSKQPVTVALARLAREGWVEIESRVGSYVARVDPSALREVAFVWFAALALMADDLVLHPDPLLLDQLRPLHRACAEALAEDRLGDTNAALRAANDILVMRYSNQKARRYLDLYRAHFGRYMMHVEASPEMHPVTLQARRDIGHATLEFYAAILNGDLAAVSAALTRVEDIHTDYLARIGAIG